MCLMLTMKSMHCLHYQHAQNPLKISLLDHFNYVTVDVTADGIYIFFYMMMVTSNLQCSIMDQRSHGNKQLFDETYFHLWIGHLFCFPLYMYIMCTVRLNKTVQARFMNKCWRHDFSLHLINLYGKFFFEKKNITSNHHYDN